MENIIELSRRDRFAAANEITLAEVGPGYAKTEMTITDRHLNGVNISHGGAIFTLADFAFAVASNSHGTVAVGINASITFFKATGPGSRLTAEARELSRNPRLATYEVAVRDENDELVAQFTGTVFRKKIKLSQLASGPGDKP